MASQSRVGAVVRRLYALLLIAVGIAYGYGGAPLLAVGGSPYYLAAGLTIVASGLFVWIGDRRGAWLYGALLIVTLVWSLWEAGLDGWGLATRLLVPLLVGCGFLVWPVRGGAISEARSRWSGWRGYGVSLAAASLVGLAAHAIGPADYADPLYQIGMEDGAAGGAGNDIGGLQQSGVGQLTHATVGGLKIAWHVDLGVPLVGGPTNPAITPLKAGDAIYVCTGGDVVSVDAETGRIIWRFRSAIAAGRPSAACRGVGYVQVPGATGLCAARIVATTIDAHLVALDAASGRPCPGFGANGRTDLITGLGEIDSGSHYVGTVPTIVRGKIILGGSVSGGRHRRASASVIRAYDAVTGQFAWAFDMGRQDDHGQPAQGKAYTLATPTSWAPMTADPASGLVYVPVGNATPYYDGAPRRPLDDLYAGAVIALDVETGVLKWSFQTAHRDLWDDDLAAQPMLIDVPAPGGVQHALIQSTRRGEIFLLDRATGKPLATVEERPASQIGRMPDNSVSFSQPVSVGLPAFGGARWRERDMWGLTPFDQMWCRIKFREARYEGRMTPPGITPSISDPGTIGGVNEGGVSVDPARSLLIVSSTRLGTYDLLVPRRQPHARAIKPSAKPAVAPGGTRYAMQTKPFLSPLGLPCNEPPYGRITAVDLKTHKLVWSRPIGAMRGVADAGGSITTAGGLIFTATQDRTIRALDLRNGAVLWSATLPAAGQATPMIYWSDRSKRQFVLVAAGGSAVPGSGAIIAYALPR